MSHARRQPAMVCEAESQDRKYCSFGLSVQSLPPPTASIYCDKEIYNLLNTNTKAMGAVGMCDGVPLLEWNLTVQM